MDFNSPYYLQRIFSSLTNLSKFSEMPLAMLLQELASLTIQFLSMERCFFVQISSNEKKIIKVVGRNFNNEDLNQISHLSQTVMAAGKKNRNLFFVEDVSEGTEIPHSESLKAQGVVSVVMAPLMVNDSLWGFVYLDTSKVKVPKTPENISNFESLRVLLQSWIERCVNTANVKKRRRERISSPLTHLGKQTILTLSQRMKEVTDRAREVAKFQMPVLLTGDDGVGKSLIARAIHEESSFADGPFITLRARELKDIGEDDTSTSSDFYAEEMLRLLKKAEGGTLFIDDVQHLSQPYQSTLNFMLSGDDWRGEGTTNQTMRQLRLVVASNANLDILRQTGTFRPDLYFRLCNVDIAIPSLRERVEDIPLLCEKFLSIYQTDGHRISIVPDAMEILQQYEWPGNVTELEALIKGLVVKLHASSPFISSDLLPPHLRPSQKVLRKRAGTRLTVEQQRERNLVVEAMRECRGVKKCAAAKLGISRPTIYSKLRMYSITEDEYR